MTDYLLYQNATSTAGKWANLLANTVTDLEQIASGELPSTASMTFFNWAMKSGQVFRYEIYNRQGYSQLVADKTVALVNISEFNPQAVRSLAKNSPVVDVLESTALDVPSFYAAAYVPAEVDGQPVAIVAAFVDQSEERHRYFATFLGAAAGLSLLTGLAFALPAIAWFRRTKEKQAGDRRIRFLAHHDAMTGLINRDQLVERLDSSLETLTAIGGSLAVHFIDLDRFKEVNDTLGHDGGDFLLKTVAERLRQATRQDDEIARLGGDEFVVVQKEIAGPEQAKQFGERLLVALGAPIRFHDNEIIATASIGVAVAPKDGTGSERLLKSADLALYVSKAEGRNRVRFFLPEMDSDLQARIKLEKAIRDAVRHETFVLHYQPVLEVNGRHLIGFEALVRLPAEDGTLIAPADFIPIAEELRLIDKIGAWVLREACRAATTWPEHLTIAVNLSPAQFAVGSISAVVADTLRETGLAPNRLELEITERLLLSDSEEVMSELRTLKSMGVSIVMDDFGTGYSSLGHLWRFPFNKIKIDRSFMQGFDGSGGDAETVVKTIIALGRELRMRVTVEGVENSRQVAFLDGAEADQVQGFFFSEPIPAAGVPAYILTEFRQEHAVLAGETTQGALPAVNTGSG